MVSILIGDIERAVASVLYKGVIGDGGFLTSDEIGERMQPRLGWVRVGHALQMLEHHHYVFTFKEGGMLKVRSHRYHLTPMGIQWFESLHKRHRRLIFSSYLEQQDIDWAKWGAIAAWLAIPVGAGVAIAIWALS